MACGCGCNGAPGGCAEPLPVFSLRGLPAGQLGQLICSSVDCTTGTAQVQQMDLVFQSADPATQAQFQSAHDGLMATLNANTTWYQSAIPFNLACCTIQDLGNQAVALTAQIQTAMGQTAITPPPSGGAAGLTLPLLLVAGGIGLALFLRR